MPKLLPMSKNVRVINEKMNELASREGDLTRELTISSRDEIGQVARSFNMFMNKLRSMMLAVKNNETRLNEVTDGMKEQIAGSVEELASIVTANAEKISGKMQSLREESHVNEQIVNELEEVLSRFTV